MRSDSDAVVVGSGPNGLAAAIHLARQGLSVHVIEAASTFGGGARTSELTLPGFRHDVCSAVHPLALASPFFRSLELDQHGLEWIYPEVDLAHPIDDTHCPSLKRSLEETAQSLGADAAAYVRLLTRFVARHEYLWADLLAPAHLPAHPLIYAEFGRHALRSAQSLAGRFREKTTRALVAGLAAHSMLRLDAPVSAAVALVLAAAAHSVGWPFPKGGAGRIIDALVACAKSLSVTFETNRLVQSLHDLPASRLIMLDLTPRQLVKSAGPALDSNYRSKLESYRYGPGVFKIDWALSEPTPFASDTCRSAGTVHLGGSFEEIAESERAVWAQRHPDKPFVIFTQPSVDDSTRAPEGQHTAWAYCHVPGGSEFDMTERIETQIERFAPGFRDTVLARHTFTTSQMESYNANYVGGDINGGVQDWRQLFRRPTSLFDPYKTPLQGVFLCSSSTPPGGGVHGMCGYHAARSALKFLARR